MTTATKTKRTVKRKAAPKASGGEFFTTTGYAKEHGRQAKTLRALIRRQIKAGKDEWLKIMEPASEKGKLSHKFKDNKTTRAKFEALLA